MCAIRDESSLCILMVGSEAVPFAKTGGLADVTSALSKALGRLGHRVTLVMPKYREVGSTDAPSIRASIVLGGRSFKIGFVEQRLGAGATVVFVHCDELYDRDGLYAIGGQAHPDNATRFGVLACAALEYSLARGMRPDVIHAHDWQTGLVPVYARTRYGDRPLLSGVPTIFTIHNLAYQGVFPESARVALDLDSTLFSVAGLEFWGQVSFLKAGINFCDLVTTVSKAYARDILTAELGYGFEGIIAARRDRLRGILNGIDTDVWDPERDPLIPETFSSSDLAGKRASKRRLLEVFRLPASNVDLSRPLVGMISRLVYQKGFDLVSEAIDELPKLGASFVVLGTGERQYEEMWRNAARRHPSAIGVRIGYDETLAHLIEAGADMFLMPSRYEPCGLNQMYSMRYGTVPIVRATGGLDDAVRCGGRFGDRFQVCRVQERCVAGHASHGGRHVWRHLSLEDAPGCSDDPRLLVDRVGQYLRHRVRSTGGTEGTGRVRKTNARGHDYWFGPGGADRRVVCGAGKPETAPD